MPLRCLKLTGVRNLAEQTLLPGPGANLLVGANGSGKTSVLEAIYLLARGRSFRTQTIEALVCTAADGCSVYGELEDDESDAGPGSPGLITRLGVSRETSGGFRYRINGENIHAASVLADAIPLVLITSHSFGLLEGSPKGRRQFLDWGLFHTAIEIRALWRQYQKALQQRNALLRQPRQDPGQLDLWDARFAEAGEAITQARETYAAEVGQVATRLLALLSPGLEAGLGWSFHPGWDRDKLLIGALRGHRDRDIMLRATQLGPHRADLRIRINGRSAAETLSRGQTKMVVLAMLLAQGAHFLDRRGRPCLNLIDDLPAELDDRHQRRVADLLAEIGGQCFVTGTDAERLRAAWAGCTGKQQPKMFHVEQGRLSESR